MTSPWWRLAGAALFLSAAASVVASCNSTSTHRQYVECQARVNEALIARTKTLIEATDRERAAERAKSDAQDATFLDESLLKSPEQRTPAERQRVFELFLKYRKAAEQLKVERAAADKARADNPVPAPPSQVCH